MKKQFWQSNTVKGLILAVIGALWGIWSRESEITQTIIVAGLGWAGIGLRNAMK